jgi:hypothetical protein
MNHPARLADRVPALLDRLAASPLALVCVLLAANAVAQPYARFSHDARLYALQVAERVQPGTFADDLFLRYGSQERYSVFTLLLAPVAARVGLEAAFFGFYLASKALFFWGAVRLGRRLIPDGPAVVLGLLCVAICPLPLGGNEVFHLNESFLTPRIACCGLVFLGLERALAGQPGAALALLAAAFPLHPLMAFGGLLASLLWWGGTRLTGRQLAALALAGCALAAVTVACEPLGARLFGHIDDDWRAVLFETNFFIDPAVWVASDWVRIAWAALVVGYAAVQLPGPAGTFLWAVLGTAAAGMAGTLVAAHSHYLLLLQASPYRAIWLMEFLAVPLAFWAAAGLWRRGTGPARCAAGVVLLLTTCDWAHDFCPGVVVFLACLPVAVVACRGLGPTPARPDWVWRSGLAGLAATFGLMLAYDAVMAALLLGPRPALGMNVGPVQVLLTLVGALYKLPVLAVMVAVLYPLLALASPGARFRLACLALWLGYQAGITGAATSPWYGDHFRADYAHQRFVVSFLRERTTPGQPPPAVYWPDHLRDVWFEARARCYFHGVQLSGCVYNRGTALEGKRRALLVRRFGIEALRDTPTLPPWWQAALHHLYEAGPEEPAPRREDLLKLCREEGLDYVILERAFDGLYAATDGRYYIYDCRQLRAREFTTRARRTPRIPEKSCCVVPAVMWPCAGSPRQMSCSPIANAT